MSRADSPTFPAIDGPRWVRVAGSPAACPPHAETWPDIGGGPAARSWVEGSSRWIDVPGMAAFRFTTDGGPAAAFAAQAVPAAAIEDAYDSVVLPALWHARGGEALHASAVRSDGGLLALCAASGGGKSTTAFALSRRGFEHAADDLVGIVVDRESVTALPFDAPPRLRPDAAAHFGGLVRQAARYPAAGPRPEPLMAVCVLARSASGAAPALERLAGGETMAAILPHAHCFSLGDPARTRLMTARYLTLAAAVPVYALRVPDGLERLPDAVDLLVTRVLARRA